MNDRTQIAAMCLQGLLAGNAQERIEDLEATAVLYADDLLKELTRTAPPAVETPLRNVKAGDVLIGTGGGRLTIVIVDYPIAVVRYRNPVTGELSEPQPYDLRANPLQCTLASAEVLAALAKN